MIREASGTDARRGAGRLRDDRDAAIGVGHEPGSQRAALFRISWTAEPGRNGERRLHGYVESTLGEPANRVQLLAQALDASGNVIGQRLEWLPEMIPALGRAYFEIRKMPPAPQYRVTVWAYDRIKGGGGA